MGPGGPGGPGDPGGWGPGPGGPGPGWGPGLGVSPGGPFGPWGPGGPWGPVFGGPLGGFANGLCNMMSSCFYSLCCCWLLQDCFGEPRGPGGRPPPF
ncbi:hypothetical protein SLA2020_034800 [Shorea laevis]